MRPFRSELTIGFTALLLLNGTFPVLTVTRASAGAAPNNLRTGTAQSKEVKALTPDTNSSESELRGPIELYTLDRGSLSRTYPVTSSPTRQARFRQFYTQWLDRLAKLDFESLGQEGRVDYILFKNHLERELQLSEIQSKQFAEVESFLPFSKTIFELEEARRRMEPVNSPKVAALLTDMKKQIEEARRPFGGATRPPSGAGVETSAGSSAESSAGSSADSGDANRADGRPAKDAAPKVQKHVALRAATAVSGLRATLRNWFEFYNGYDPVFTWWADEPYKSVDQALQAYASFLSERVAGVRSAVGAATPPDPRATFERGGGAEGAGGQRPGGADRARPTNARPGDSSDIVGDPIGREALLAALAAEMIPYTPEELIAIANKEMAWCDAEMQKASRELGHGDDWRKALEQVKGLYVEPGKQPELIRELAVEAIEFVEKNDLVTVPALARESWRMQMMTPDRQLVNPFFTGGETISVSYPTNAMSHEQKLMSMRGNNIHFARATVHHELIPGHHLQGFMNARYRPYRAPFRTPFWGEGWALYWEMLLWDMKFPKTPENRVGMLFWRMHRCARIIFSLSFHLGRMSPQEAIDFLVKRVGHEPENATAEVRRSFAGSYDPLYQAAYLLGGLQIYSLRRELVASGKMTDRAFHDAILKGNSIPIEMVRASLTKQKLARDHKSNWKFYGPNPGGP